MNNLLIVGAGQYSSVVLEIANEMNCFDKIDFLDDNSEKAVGKISEMSSFVKDYKSAVCAIGNNPLRVEITNKLIEAGFEVPAFVSQKASVSPSAKIEQAVIIEPMAVVQANAVVSKATLVCAGAVVKHNAVVEQGCYLDCNCVVSAGAKVQSTTKIESNVNFK